jgi:nucleotide-binding universal stress UspA family protein
MALYRKILVALEYSSIDRELIRASARLQELGTEEIIFVNVIPEFNLPEEISAQFPHFEENTIRERKEQLMEKIRQYFVGSDHVRTCVEILQGQPAKNLLKYASRHKVDLIVSGKKKNSLGVVKSRLARRADCSFLMIAEGLPFDLKRILVPIDFSEHSELAIQNAIAFAKIMSRDVEIFAQNVYNVPAGYHYTGKSYEDFAAVMKKNAEKDFQKFLRKVDTQGIEIKPIYSLDDNDDFVSDIQDKAEELEAGLVIVGAKGQTAASALFIGSRAERIVMMPVHTSMLVVRKPGEKSGVLDFIQEL